MSIRYEAFITGPGSRVELYFDDGKFIGVICKSEESRFWLSKPIPSPDNWHHGPIETREAAIEELLDYVQGEDYVSLQKDRIDRFYRRHQYSSADMASLAEYVLDKHSVALGALAKE